MFSIFTHVYTANVLGRANLFLSVSKVKPHLNLNAARVLI